MRTVKHYITALTGQQIKIMIREKALKNDITLTDDEYHRIEELVLKHLEEHRARGYKEISAARAAELAEIAGYELEEEE